MSEGLPLTTPNGVTAPAATAIPPEALYLTAEQTAALLQVSAKSLYRWALQDPSLPCLRIKGTIRFPRERVIRWFRDREQGTPRTRSQVRSPAKPAKLMEADGA